MFSVSLMNMLGVGDTSYAFGIILRLVVRKVMHECACVCEIDNFCATSDLEISVQLLLRSVITKSDENFARILNDTLMCDSCVLTDLKSSIQVACRNGIPHMH